MRALLLGLLVACTGDQGPADTDPTGSEPALDPVASPSLWVPSVLQVTWAAPASGASWVQWGTDPETLDQQTPTSAAQSVERSLLGLPAREAVHWQAVTEAEDGTRWTSSVRSFEVPAPARLPSLDIVVHDPDTAEVPGGYLMAAVTNGLAYGAGAVTSVGIWRASDGVPVWWMDLPMGSVSVSPAWSDHHPAVRYDALPGGPESPAATGHLVWLDGSDRVEDPLLNAHHLAIETQPDTWAWLAGYAEADGDRLDLTDVVYEAPMGDTSAPTLVFDQRVDVFAGVAPTTCEHNSEPSQLFPVPDLYEWVHSNSMHYDAPSDALYVYGRFVDSLWKIDRASGALQWQLGGPGGDFTDPTGGSLWDDAASSRLWSHAHMTDLWEGGALVFDNGDHHDPRVSGVVEIAWDEAARTAWEVWRYDSPDDLFMFVLGDARRLPSDHVLISWTTTGRLTEVDRSGALLWEAEVRGGLQVSRVRWVADLYEAGGAR